MMKDLLKAQQWWYQRNSNLIPPYYSSNALTTTLLTTSPYFQNFTVVSKYESKKLTTNAGVCFTNVPFAEITDEKKLIRSINSLLRSFFNIEIFVMSLNVNAGLSS